MVQCLDMSIEVAPRQIRELDVLVPGFTGTKRTQ